MTEKIRAGVLFLESDPRAWNPVDAVGIATAPGDVISRWHIPGATPDETIAALEKAGFKPLEKLIDAVANE